MKRTLKIKIQTELEKGDACSTYYMRMYVCHHRSPNDHLNRGEKEKPGFYHSDGPGNAFIYLQIYDQKSPLCSHFVLVLGLSS